MIEKRLSNENVTVNEESRHIEGYALVFDVPSTGLSRFTEIIQRGALDGVIEKSDVVATMDHNTSRGILARSTNGVGSLTLEIDERGLKYSFDAPHTALGDELLEGIKRGDIRASSFMFVVEKDSWEIRDGQKFRTIEKIKQLYDISCVVSPAYDATSVVIADTRGADMLDEAEAREAEEEEKPDNTEETPNQTEEEKPTEEEAPKEETPDNTEEEPKEENSCDGDSNKEENEGEAEENPEEDNKPSEEDEDKTAPEGEAVEEEPKEGRNSDTDNLYNQKTTNIRTMSKINLTQAIRAAYSGKISEEQATVFNEARSKMIANGLAVADNEIVMPFEQRATPPATANGVFTASYSDAQGAVTVQENVLDILEPLRNSLILSEAGATILTGLRGNIRLPKLGKGNAYFASETEEAQKSGQTFDKLEMKPCRISAYVPISRQLLMQSEDTNIDSILTRDLMAAIAERIESQFLSDDAGDDTKFAGIFNGVTPNTTALKYDDIVDYETELEEANVKNFLYLLNPKSAGVMRKTKVDSGSGKFVMEDGEILGRKALVSGNVVNNGVAVVDAKDIVMGIWGNGMTVMVDPYTSALNDVVNIIATVYVDVKMRRDEAVVAKILK